MNDNPFIVEYMLFHHYIMSHNFEGTKSECLYKIMQSIKDCCNMNGFSGWILQTSIDCELLYDRAHTVKNFSGYLQDTQLQLLFYRQIPNPNYIKTE